MSETMAANQAEAPRQEVATIRSDPTRWHYGERIENDDSILRTRGAAKGLALYDELERDPQVGCELGKRRMALLGREWSVDAGAEDPRAVAARDMVERALKGCKLNQAVEKLLDAILKGFSVAEVMWVIRGGEVVPAELRGRDPMRFTHRLPPAGAEVAPADPATVPPIAELRLLVKGGGLDGVPVPERKFVVHRFGAKYESPWGRGLGERLFWPVFFKRQGIGFWLSGLEKFGQPTPLGKYPAGTGDAEQAKLLQACQAIATEAGVIVPEGMVIELLEAKRNGTFDSYEGLARYMDEDISKVILGQTLTTSPGQAGSRALGEVHNEVRLELTKGDADLLSDTLNGGLVRWIVDVNLPGYASLGLSYPSVWWDVSQPEDLAARADRDTKLKALGYRPTPDYVRDTYGEGWEPDARPGAGRPGAAGGDLAALFAEASEDGRYARLRRALRQSPGAEGRDAAEHLAEQLDTVAGKALDGVVDALRALVMDETVTSMEELRRRLVLLLPELPTARLAELMGQAFTVAALQGRADLTDGV